MRAVVLIIVLFLISLGSCESENENAEESQSTPILIRLNFNENIHSLDPFLAETRSEVFIRELVYQVLFKSESGKIISDIIDEHYFDLAESKHMFIMNDSLFFSDGEEVHSGDIILSIERWLNKNENPQLVIRPDSITPQSFSIVSALDHEDLVDRLSKTPIPIVNSNGLGSGDFYVVESDADISCKLSRVKENHTDQNIDRIEMRFIKNQNEMVEVFWSGDLDLVEIQSIGTLNNKNLIKATNILDNQYSDYQCFKSEYFDMTIAELQNINDTLLRNHIRETLIQDSIHFIGSIAWRGQSIPITPFDYRYKKVDTPRVVIHSLVKQRNIESLLDNAKKRVEETTKQNIDLKNLAVVSVDPYYYFTKFQIKNVSDEMSLSEIVIDALVVNPVEY